MSIELLFSVLTADLEEEMVRVKWGRVRLEERRVYTLAYTDDVILLRSALLNDRATG